MMILKNAPVMILDEPTEGLDSATEATVMRALRPRLADRTVLLITHRESLVRSTDLVWRMGGALSLLWFQIRLHVRLHHPPPRLLTRKHQFR